MSTDQEIITRLRELHELSFVHTEGFKCFKQFEIESSGLEPEATERWITDNGGYLKHIDIPEHIRGREIGDPPRSAPCYFIPDALLA